MVGRNDMTIQELMDYFGIKRDKKGYFKCSHGVVGNDIRFLIRTCPKCSEKLTVKK